MTFDAYAEARVSKIERFQNETAVRHSSMMRELDGRLRETERKLKALENDRIPPTTLTTRMQELAAQQQATEYLYAPLRESRHQTPILTDERIFAITKEAGFGDIAEICKGYPEDREGALSRVRHLLALAYAPEDQVPEQQQATEHLYAPLRSDTRAVVDLAAFARRLLDMQDLGHAVTEEVRALAKRALGVGQ